MKKVGLVLSGGGERGWIQLGMIEVLEKEKIPFDIITGSSVGGLIGLALASNFTAKEIITKVDVIKDKDIKRTTSDNYSIYDPSAAFEKAKKIFGDKNIEDLPKKFAVVAVDFLTGEEVVIDKGPAWNAVKATSAIPAIFPPVEYEGKLLIDGGILNILPVDVAYKIGADITIGLDVSGFGAGAKFSPKQGKLNPVVKRLIKTTKNPYIAAIAKRGYLFESLYQSARIMSARIRNEKLARYPPTLLLEAYHPPKEPTSLNIFDKKLKKNMLDIGRDIAMSEIEKIKQLLEMVKG